jgi:hypothetical protein
MTDLKLYFRTNRQPMQDHLEKMGANRRIPGVSRGKKKDSTGRAPKDSSEREEIKTLEPLNPMAGLMGWLDFPLPDKSGPFIEGLSVDRDHFVVPFIQGP